MTTFTINHLDAEERLDKFLVEKFPDLSRTQLQKLIKQGAVLVNQKKVSKHYALVENDSVVIDFDEQEEKEKKEVKLVPNKNIKLDIVFEDGNYLVLNKSAGIVVHPGEAHPENDTLINGVLAYYPELKEVGENKLRYGVIHRLDREVSGVMVIAKTQQAFLNLKKQFKQRTVYKEYLALVHGKMAEKHGRIELSIERSRTKGYKMAARPDDSGKPAITDYEVLQEFRHFSYLKVIIHTGRTHQIRVHLNALGNPVVGDKVYRPRSLRSRAQLDRIFLHAKQLEFDDLTGERLEFSKEIPQELKDFLTTCST